MSRRNSFSMFPLISARSRHVLNASEGLEDNSCYRDPETGEIVCDVTEEGPPEDDSEIPPDDEGIPPDDDEEPPIGGERHPKDEILPAIFGAIIQVLASILAPSSGLAVIQNSEPFDLPQRRQLNELSRTVKPIQTRTLPPRAPKPSEVMNGLVNQSLNVLRQAQNRQLEKEFESLHQTTQGRPDVVQALVQAYGPGSLQPLRQLERQQATPYDTYQPNEDPVTKEALLRLLNPASGYNTPFIQEDPSMLTQGLMPTRKQVNLADQLRQSQLDAMAIEQFQAQQELLQEQAALARAQRQAIQQTRQPLKAQISKNRSDTVIQEAFRDPVKPEQSIVRQSERQERLSESKLSQAELNLDNMLAQGKISKSEYQQLAVAAKALAARNWLTHDGQDNGDGTVTYREVTMDKAVAPLVAYADAKRYWDKEVHLSTQELAKAASDIAEGIYDFFIGDDIKTLQDPKATVFSKVLAGGSLALTLGGGFIEKAAIKIGGKFIALVVGKSNKVVEILKKSGLNEKQIEQYMEFVKDRGIDQQIEVRHLPNGGKVFQTSKPAKNIPDSYTIWQTQIDTKGNRIILEKTTYAPDGTIVHSKQYYPEYVRIDPPKGTR